MNKTSSDHVGITIYIRTNVIGCILFETLEVENAIKRLYSPHFDKAVEKAGWTGLN